MDKNVDTKYIVFKRDDFYQMMGHLALPPYNHPSHPDPIGGSWDCAPIASHIQEVAEKTALNDAVVIRTQDIVAPPVLDLYANMLHLLKGDSNPAADYFHARAVESWNRGDRKFPD